MNLKETAIKLCLEARERAILNRNSSTKVGACIYTKNEGYYIGFNIQNKCHKSYHAEEIALINYILINDKDSNNILGIIVSFSDNNIEKLTFCCGHCRQILWEYTHNSNLLITEVDLDGDIIKEMELGKLYPYPYPDFKDGDKRSNMENVKIQDTVQLVRESNEKIEGPNDKPK